MSDMSITMSDKVGTIRTYPNTTIADPSTETTVTQEELRDDADRFRVTDFNRERLLFRPITATVMRSNIGDHPAVHTDVMVLSGSRKGAVFSNSLVLNPHIVKLLTAVLDSPFVQVTAGVVGVIGKPDRPEYVLSPLTSTKDISHAENHAAALRWNTSTPITDKELLGWNLSQERKRNKLSQEDAAEMLGVAQPTLSAIESGARNVTAFELRDFARMYRTTMARILP